MRLLRQLPTSLLPLLLLSLSPSCAVIAERAPNPRCGEACHNTLREVRFQDHHHNNETRLPVGGKECGADSLLRTSKYLCMRLFCTEEEGRILAESLQRTCRDVMGVDDVPGMESVEGYTDEEMSSLKRLGKDEAGSKEEEVVVPEEEFWVLWFRTLEVTKYVYGNNTIYGWLMGVFWAAVVAIGMVNKVMALYPQSNRAAESSTWRWLKSKLNTPAAFGNRCAQSYGVWATVPPRVQTLAVVLFIVLNVVLSVVGYEFFPGNMYYPKVSHQVLRFVSDRTGVISMANFPLIWLFGMRNNVVIWLTGWDFGTYNNFHRWVARVSTIQAIVHSIGYTWLILLEGGWPYFWSWWERMFWWTGELATIMMSALMGLSVYWLRRSSYEVFLIIHIALSILILLTMLGHVSIFEGEYDALVWVPAFIWVIDRVLRTTRILSFNVQFWNTRAHVSYNESSNMVRLEVPCSSSLYTATPGTYFFLMVLNGSRFWESHPFTVASTPSSLADEKEDANRQGESSPLLESAELLPEEGNLVPNIDEDDESMTFLIRPYDDFTNRLRETAAGSHKPVPLRIAIEGPYGHTQPFHQFDHVLFVVGGSGIVVPLSYRRRLASGTPRPKSVRVHWTVREPGFAEDVIDRDFGGVLSERMKLDVYVTSSSSEGRGLIMHRQDGEGDGVSSLPSSSVQYHKGRVDPRRVVEAECENATNTSSVAVVACGPARMADATRRATADAMARCTGLRIEYFEESFQW